MRLRLLSSVALGGVMTCFVAFRALGECMEAPNCTDLGYSLTASDCPKGYVKCPWNTGLVWCECGDEYQYTCDGANETAGTKKCGDKYTDCGCASGYTKENGNCVRSCAVGDIYYSDNTYSSDLVAGKTVLGIVVHVTDDGKHGQIMAPWTIDASGNKSDNDREYMVWGSTTDLESLPNYTTADAVTDYDSCGNTDKIVAAGDASTYAAAWAVRKYAPTTDTAGKWCLPAAGIKTDIENNLDTIRAAIAKVGGVNPNLCYWTSTEHDSQYAFQLCITTTVYLYYGMNHTKSAADTSVRPVLEFYSGFEKVLSA